MRRAGWLVGLSLLLGAANAEARGCHEVSQIVGKQRCSRFGDAWNVSRSRAWVFSVGQSVASFPVAGARFAGAVAGGKADAAPLAVSGDHLGRWTAFTPELRIAVFPSRVSYLGVEGQVGAGWTPAAHAVPVSNAAWKPSAPLDPALAVHLTGFTTQALGAVAGASVPVGRFDLSLELLGGFRVLRPGFDWDRPAAAYAAAGGCKRGVGCPSVTTDGYDTVVARVEPRAGVAFRFNPWMTLRALVGFDAMARGAPSATALFEMHTRPYDAFHPRRRTPAE